MELTRRQFLQLGATSTGAVGLSPLGFDLVPARQVKQRLRVEGANVSQNDRLGISACWSRTVPPRRTASSILGYAVQVQSPDSTSTMPPT